MAKLIRLNPQDYTVAWLCALPKSELVAATMMLDERHEELRLNQQDKNLYTYGSINSHNVVLACLPPGQPGKLSGLKLVQPLSQSFPNLRIHLFVGIGGGVPRDPPPEDPQQDIHLGDVAVGWAEKTGDPGVVQWDYVRYHGQDKVESLGSLNKPDWQLLAALGSMLRDREMGEKPFYAHLTGLKEKTSKFARPGQDNDKLFERTYEHVDNDTNPDPCNQCKPSQLARRSRRTTQEPVFHQGTIASGDSVMQNAERRDAVSRRFHNAICFEMEAAGVIDETRCLVIRGISDYSDSHKNGLWQNYAAATAAAFAKQFLFTIQPSSVAGIDPLAVSETIQALSSPLKAINQALPLIQQQTENTAISIRAMRHEAHDSRQDTRTFHGKVFEEFTNLADRVESSPSRLETSIVMTLDRQSAGMNQMKHDLQIAHAQHTGEVVAKLEALNQSIKGLQIGIISKPGLMQSVCEENYRLENLSGSGNARRDGWLQLRDGRMKKRQRCSCKLKPKSSHFKLAPNRKWKFTFETESFSHHRTCALFVSSSRTTMARFRMGSCGALLAGAIEASISITRGAGGSSISPVLRCAYVVPHNNPAFSLLRMGIWDPPPMYGSRIVRNPEALLDSKIHKLELLFRAGKASPYDIDLEGNTLLHVAVEYCEYWLNLGKTEKLPNVLLIEAIVRFLKRLEELCVPLNWTNDYNLTFMNEFVLKFPISEDPFILVTSATRLLDTGAEFAKFSKKSNPGWLKCIGMTRYASCAEFLDAPEENEMGIAILHQSEQELVEALRHWPHSINQTNRLMQTPLHVAVGWPCGVKVLLQHGAWVNPTDFQGYTPLYHAIHLGFAETVSLLMKADCSLALDDGYWSENFLWHVSQYFGDEGYAVWGVSQETRINVLDTAIASLAERRHDLQSRVVALPMAVNINTGVFRDDRILDEYAEYAESAEKDARREYDHMPLRASSLLKNCQTVYHIKNLNVEIAEKFWQNGFRDIDVPNYDGRTPLMLSRFVMYDRLPEIEVCSWLIQKGAKLHRPQDSPLDYDPDRTLDPMELPPKIRALHYVAANIGCQAGYLAGFEVKSAKQLLQKQLSQLSKDARLLPATILSDVSYDDCVCACSSQGCLASTMMLKLYRTWIRVSARESFALATEYLVSLVGPHNPCWDWLIKEIIRFRTFQELDLRHTCCRWDMGSALIKLESEERAEIRDEDHEKIELLESLLEEFEDNRGEQDLLSFLKGFWATRMDQVLQEQGTVNEEALREIGVVLHDEMEESGVVLHQDGMEEGDSDNWQSDSWETW